jgi:hypothetical protein
MPEFTRDELAAAEIRSEDLRWADIRPEDVVTFLYKPTGEIFTSTAHRYVNADGFHGISVLEYDVGGDQDEFEHVTLLKIERPAAALPTTTGSIVRRTGSKFEAFRSDTRWLWAKNGLPTEPETWYDGWTLIRDAGEDDSK